MNNRLFTLLEIGLIAGLILAVLYFGGAFNPPPAPPTSLPTSIAPTDAPQPTATIANTPRPTRTPRPTPVPTIPLTAPALSQPAGLIAFGSTRDGNAEIYVIGADGSGQTNLTRNPAEDYYLAWSPDGRKLAFLSSRTGWQEIFIMNADGTQVSQLTHTWGSNTAPGPPLAWSPDGQYILAVRSSIWRARPTTPGYQALEAVRADGAGSLLLYEAQDYEYLWQPSWSPDNRHIALGINRESCRFYVAEFDGSQLEFDPLVSNCLPFDWSPDGSRLAYLNAGIEFYDVSGELQTSRREVSVSSGFASWSPDGLHLLYTDSNGLVDGLSLDGRRLLQLNLEWVYDNAPDWSPDSQWLAFVDSQQADIGILNIYDPANAVLLTRTNNNFSPQWQPAP